MHCTMINLMCYWYLLKALLPIGYSCRHEWMALDRMCVRDRFSYESDNYDVLVAKLI